MGTLFTTNRVTDGTQQLTNWNRLLNKIDGQETVCFSLSEIQDLLNQIQTYVNSGLPDVPDYERNLRSATDAIYEASLILTELDGSGDRKFDLERASQQICMALRSLCN